MPSDHVSHRAVEVTVQNQIGMPARRAEGHGHRKAAGEKSPVSRRGNDLLWQDDGVTSMLGRCLRGGKQVAPKMFQALVLKASQFTVVIAFGAALAPRSDRDENVPASSRWGEVATKGLRHDQEAHHRASPPHQ